ncbi:holin family protein [Loktanella sp. F6476L]|uniref:holin family protein n=1 Tax=Loktanella sp. F6476L TaxID=2926405 RepID=UPI001FF6CFAB|nr:holin family protein [Loktanella sp. F6476L]MCK0119710.1 holin family protein [Loktanella sp. F6476L]
MGIITDFMGMLFGNHRNVLAETAEVFRENSENAGARAADVQTTVLRQFAAEFSGNRKGWFDRFIDGLNRLPRPLMAFGTLALIAASMVDPIWFAARMQGLALVPEPLWWLMGAIVSFYFGARHQAKGQEFQQSIADTMARTGQVTANIQALTAVAPPAPPSTHAKPLAFTTENAALQEWQAQNGS